MRAIWKTIHATLELREIPEPVLEEDDDVKIRVRYCTIGDMDLRMYHEGDFCAREGIAGYEITGEIVELGNIAKKAGWQVGDRVTCLPLLYCGQCRFCLNHQENRCVDILSPQGVLCSYIVRKSRQLVKLPEMITDQMGCLLWSVAEILEAVEKLNIQLNDSVAITGGGFAGIIAIQLFKMRGASQTVVVDPSVRRRDIALAFGADCCIDPESPLFQKDMLKRTKFLGFDNILETSGDLNLFHKCMGYVSRGGKLCLMMNYGMEQNLMINTASLFYSNASILTSFMFNNKMTTAIELLPKIFTNQLIDKEYPFARALDAFQHLQKRENYKIGIKMC